MIKTVHAIIGCIISMCILTWSFTSILDEKHKNYLILQEKLLVCQEEVLDDMIFKTTVTLTMYNPTRGQTDSTPNVTADGTRINIWKASNYRFVAVSRDLLKRWDGPLDYGDWIVVEGAGKDSGIYQVRDTMNPRFTRRVDILKTSGTKQFRYNNITLIKYDNNNYNEITEKYLTVK